MVVPLAKFLTVGSTAYLLLRHEFGSLPDDVPHKAQPSFRRLLRICLLGNRFPTFYSERFML